MEQHGRLKITISELHVYLEADDVCLMVVKETTKAPVLQDKVPYGWDLHSKSFVRLRCKFILAQVFSGVQRASPAS